MFYQDLESSILLLWLFLYAIDVGIGILLWLIISTEFWSVSFIPCLPRRWVREGYRCIFGETNRHFHRNTSRIFAVGFGQGASGKYDFGPGLKGGARSPRRRNNNIEKQFTELDLQDLEEQVAAIRANTVSARSRRIYINSSVKFVTWLLANKKQLLNDEFVYLAGEAPNKKVFIKSVIVNAPNGPPIFFDLLSAKVFMT